MDRLPPADFLRDTLEPGLAWVAAHGGPAPSRPATVLLLAIAIQESGLCCRAQQSAGGAPGPARSFWQFEMGGIRGVLAHPVSGPMAEKLCRACIVEPSTVPVWRAIEGNDRLAAAFARLLLLTDHGAIPTSQAAAWECYAKRLWRPGKPDPERWAHSWAEASDAVRPA